MFRLFAPTAQKDIQETTVGSVQMDTMATRKACWDNQLDVRSVTVVEILIPMRLVTVIPWLGIVWNVYTTLGMVHFRDVNSVVLVTMAAQQLTPSHLVQVYMWAFQYCWLCRAFRIHNCGESKFSYPSVLRYPVIKREAFVFWSDDYLFYDGDVNSITNSGIQDNLLRFFFLCHICISF